MLPAALVLLGSAAEGMELAALGGDVVSTFADDGTGGENVVSGGLGVVLDGMDAAGRLVGGARDEAGAAIRGAVENIPVVGGVLACATDVAGDVVDGCGGVWTEAIKFVGGAQSVSNAVGAVTVGARGVRSKVVDDIADANIRGDTVGRAARSVGVMDAIPLGIFSIVGDVGRQLGVIEDDGVTGKSSRAADAVEELFSGAEVDADVMAAVSDAVRTSALDEQAGRRLAELSGSGKLSSDALRRVVVAVESGSLTWDDVESSL
jgi:hypothetical protein